eukprot:gnl/Dysnectes_brevis/7926_a13745_228.p1 GENE.gnl/Dysnectes_brevis/7926_a13745_228~~gnl/Dysnectes_brevis/7926_a13745_228.p1  ORF type:complete len:1064 (+),score=266.46 gnl/Dysnectes_brevis/7926_a13745_228:437-3193(+)
MSIALKCAIDGSNIPVRKVELILDILSLLSKCPDISTTIIFSSTVSTFTWGRIRSTPGSLHPSLTHCALVLARDTKHPIAVPEFLALLRVYRGRRPWREQESLLVAHLCDRVPTMVGISMNISDVTDAVLATALFGDEVASIPHMDSAVHKLFSCLLWLARDRKCVLSIKGRWAELSDILLRRVRAIGIPKTPTKQGQPAYKRERDLLLEFAWSIFNEFPEVLSESPRLIDYIWKDLTNGHPHDRSILIANALIEQGDPAISPSVLPSLLALLDGEMENVVTRSSNVVPDSVHRIATMISQFLKQDSAAIYGVNAQQCRCVATLLMLLVRGWDSTIPCVSERTHQLKASVLTILTSAIKHNTSPVILTSIADALEPVSPKPLLPFLAAQQLSDPVFELLHAVIQGRDNGTALGIDVDFIRILISKLQMESKRNGVNADTAAVFGCLVAAADIVSLDVSNPELESFVRTTLHWIAPAATEGAALRHGVAFLAQLAWANPSVICHISPVFSLVDTLVRKLSPFEKCKRETLVSAVSLFTASASHNVHVYRNLKLRVVQTVAELLWFLSVSPHTSVSGGDAKDARALFVCTRLFRTMAPMPQIRTLLASAMTRRPRRKAPLPALSAACELLRGSGAHNQEFMMQEATSELLGALVLVSRQQELVRSLLTVHVLSFLDGVLRTHVDEDNVIVVLVNIASSQESARAINRHASGALVRRALEVGEVDSPLLQWLRVSLAGRLCAVESIPFDTARYAPRCLLSCIAGDNDTHLVREMVPGSSLITDASQLLLVTSRTRPELLTSQSMADILEFLNAFGDGHRVRLSDAQCESLIIALTNASLPDFECIADMLTPLGSIATTLFTSTDYPNAARTMAGLILSMTKRKGRWVATTTLGKGNSDMISKLDALSGLDPIYGELSRELR